jgi:hypothetical protein
MAVEKWKTSNFSVYYEVSTHGRVRSWKPIRNYAKSPIKPRLLKPTVDKDGYHKIVLFKNKKRFDFRVAVLVAETYISKRPKGCVLRHLDGSKTNDYVRNLKWGTPQENSDDTLLHGTRIKGNQVNTCKLNNKKVQLILNSNSGHSELAKKYRVSPGAIWHIRANKTWKHINRRVNNG